MKKIFIIMASLAFLLSCNEEIEYITGEYFSTDKTQVNFDSSGGQQSVGILNATSAVSASIVSDNSGWCTVSTSGDQLIVKVEDNILAKSRVAKVSVKCGAEEVLLLVRQARKYFTYIPSVKNLQAIPGLGEVTLKWEEPEEDNFSHVILSFKRFGSEEKVILSSGTTEYSVKELKNADGLHDFTLQSVDIDGELGNVAKVSAIPEKLVALRFESDPKMQWIPYYLKESNTCPTKLRMGSLEFNEGESVSIKLAVDPSLLDDYNQQNGTDYKLLPSEACSIPDHLIYNSQETYQTFTLDIDITTLQDRTIYCLPLRIESASPALVSDVKPTVTVFYNVDDLAGWYTVERLAKCGESQSNYPADVNSRRRYIVRTGDTTWETGYLFRAYSKSENHTGTGTNVQYISIDPATKAIHIQQNGYAVSTSNNVFDLLKNELKIEYLYADWEGWWTHERMFDRSFHRD